MNVKEEAKVGEIKKETRIIFLLPSRIHPSVLVTRISTYRPPYIQATPSNPLPSHTLHLQIPGSFYC
jgi:hypothetical protein